MGGVQTFSIPFSPTEFPRAAIPVRDPHAHAGRSHEIEPEWEIGFASLSLRPAPHLQPPTLSPLPPPPPPSPQRDLLLAGLNPISSVFSPEEEG